MKKPIGSSFEAFLEEKGIKDDVELRAQKEILAEQIREAMERKGVSFSALASSMGTSRTVVYRLLDPGDTGVTLETLSRVARALGLGLKVSLARAPSAGTRCQFETPWDHRLCRVMGPGRRINTTRREGASYRSRRRSIFHRAPAPPRGPGHPCWARRPGRERPEGQRRRERGWGRVLLAGAVGGGSAASSVGLSLGL